MENELKGKKATLHYLWTNGTEYTVEAEITFGDAGLFLKNTDDTDFADALAVFVPYGRVIGIEFHA
jgi:hypothetical protein